MGVFDFDKVVFAEMWRADAEEPKKKKEMKKKFFKYVRYYLADYRVLWAEFLTHNKTPFFIITI